MENVIHYVISFSEDSRGQNLDRSQAAQGYQRVSAYHLFQQVKFTNLTSHVTQRHQSYSAVSQDIHISTHQKQMK